MILVDGITFNATLIERLEEVTPEETRIVFKAILVDTPLAFTVHATVDEIQNKIDEALRNLN